LLGFGGVAGVRSWLFAVAAALLVACGGGDSNSAASGDGAAALALQECAAAVRINEVSLVPVTDTGTPSELVRVEVFNAGECSADMSRLRLLVDTITTPVQPGALGPSSFHVIEFTRSPCSGCSLLQLLDVAQNAVVDEVLMPEPAGSVVGIARHPDGSGDFAAQDPAQQSFGAPNEAAAVVSRLAATTALRPSDSSPNAILAYDGTHWILGGWSNWAHDVWYSVAKVWRSSDGVSWRDTQALPPYSPYSAFVVFQGRMWALGPTSYSSADGVVWRSEALSLQLASRAAVFRGHIVAVEAGRVLRSTDGLAWEVLQPAPPWGSERWEPHLLVHRDHLWLLGGEDGEGSGGTTLRNDVWSSADGVEWTRMTDAAPWAPRRWASSVAHDDKLFVVNGANPDLWPEEYGNVADIWYSADGVEWLQLQLGPLWGARHASYVVSDPSGGFLLSSGYGHGGVSRIYNDVWRFRASMYFPKPRGDLFDPQTWGSHPDGSGQSPKAFDQHDALFVFRNRAVFVLNRPFPARSVLVGDGRDQVEVRFEAPVAQRLHLYVSSHGTADLCQKGFAVRHVAAQGSVVCRTP
jgi:hypothetical protein